MVWGRREMVKGKVGWKPERDEEGCIGAFSLSLFGNRKTSTMTSLIGSLSLVPCV